LQEVFMVRSGILAVAGILCAGIVAAQSDKDLQGAPQTAAAPTAQTGAGALPEGAAIRATITSSINSKKLKPGEKITAETTAATKVGDNVVMPSGAKLIGHVTQTAARSKGDAFSTVGITFDKAILKHNEEVPLNVTIQALASSPQSASSAPDMSAMGSAPMGSGGSGQAASSTMARPGTPSSMAPPPTAPTGNVTNTVGNTDTNNAIAGKGAAGGLDNSGQLTPESRGVFGLQGIGLAAGTVGTEPSTVITSTDKEVRLDSGTQILLVTQAVQVSNAAH
jgi:hypothetical protein